MTTVSAIFADLTGQQHAGRFLSAAIERDRASHAYLFLGPSGAGKEAAAIRLAAALCCQDGGCGSCSSCVKAIRGIHPDIETVSPEGAFIRIEQVREVNRRLSLRPHESRARVFIFKDAAAFNAESANAFLKSLEEPPPFAYFVLLGKREDMILPTLVSRCQPFRFGPVPAEEIKQYLLDHQGIKATEAEAFAHLSAGDLRLAVQLAEDGQLLNRRLYYIQLAQNFTKGAWEGGVSQMMAEVASAVELDEASSGAGNSANVPAGFITAPKKKVEEDAKRRARAVRMRELAFALNMMESWFRDMMVSAAGAGEAVLNKDFELELERQALPSKITGYREALEAIQAARAKLGYNVDVELALQAMFLKLQEVL